MNKNKYLLLLYISILLVASCAGTDRIQKPLPGRVAAIVWANESEPDGFSWVAGTTAVWMTNADGTGAGHLLTSPDGWGCPRWSPDGTRLSLVNWDLLEGAYGGYYIGDIYIITMEGLALTPAGKTNSCVSWSPDGERILFSYEGKLYVLELSTGHRVVLAQLTPPSSGGQLDWTPDWSPNGNSIIFDMEDSIYEMSIVSPARNLLLKPERECGYRNPRYSPDTTKIAFTRICRTGSAVWVSSICLANLDDLRTTCPIEGYAPKWSPDGARIAFLDGQGIRVANIGGFETGWLTNDPQWEYVQFDWGP